MPNNSTSYSKWALAASIIALVISILSLCAGLIAPYASFLCPMPAIVLAAISLSSKRKKLPVVALVFSILSFSVLAIMAVVFWTNTTNPNSIEMRETFGQLFGSIGGLIQTLILLIKVKLNIP